MLLKPKALALIALGSLFLIACGFLYPFGRSPRGMGPGFGYRGGDFESNGEQIYFTATNDRGEYIRYTDGPAFGGMMGGSLSCASCHGDDGRGGQYVMHMDVMDAPDIRFEALSAEESGHQEGEQNDAHGEDEEYNLETFRLYRGNLPVIPLIFHGNDAHTKIFYTEKGPLPPHVLFAIQQAKTG